MRITPAILNKIVQDTVTQRSKSDRDLLAVYVHGSLLSANPLLGGATDIDLFFVHNADIPESREIVRITDNVHLDIAHHSRDLYRVARELRLHPWMGPSIYDCKIVYDPQHFMDFTQASVRGQFNQPDNVIYRARTQAEHARQIWFSLQNGVGAADLGDCAQYLLAVEHAANAIASLSGSPLTERRFLISFAEKAEAVGHRGLFNGLLGLLGGPSVDAEVLRTWLPAWQTAFEAVSSKDPPPRFNPCRLNYYLRAFEEVLAGEQPHCVLWPLAKTWTALIGLLPQAAPERVAWLEVGNHLGLLGEGIPQRVVALDSYLDTIEEVLDAWAEQYGLS
jgi:hypothetical protein